MGLSLAIVTSVGVGTCTCHDNPTSMSGIIINGSGNVGATGIGVAQVGVSIVLGKCGHTGILVSGASTVKANGLSVGQITSVFSGCFSGVIITGSQTVTGT